MICWIAGFLLGILVLYFGFFGEILYLLFRALYTEFVHFVFWAIAK